MADYFSKWPQFTTQQTAAFGSANYADERM
jgi:hypothetical protein